MVNYSLYDVVKADQEAYNRGRKNGFVVGFIVSGLIFVTACHFYLKHQDKTEQVITKNNIESKLYEGNK